MTLALLYLLGSLDGAFTGIRSAGGRNALIDKQRHYAIAMLYGFLVGQILLLSGVAFGMAVAYLAPPREPREFLDRFVRAGDYLLDVYLPYGIVMMCAFLIRAMPSVDIRSMTSVLVFGPLTLGRPIVGALGMAWALWHVPDWRVGMVCAYVLLAMLALDWILIWRWRMTPTT